MLKFSPLKKEAPFNLIVLHSLIAKISRRNRPTLAVYFLILIHSAVLCNPVFGPTSHVLFLPNTKPTNQPRPKPSEEACRALHDSACCPCQCSSIQFHTVPGFLNCFDLQSSFLPQGLCTVAAWNLIPFPASCLGLVT